MRNTLILFFVVLGFSASAATVSIYNFNAVTETYLAYRNGMATGVSSNFSSIPSGQFGTYTGSTWDGQLVQVQRFNLTPVTAPKPSGGIPVVAGGFYVFIDFGTNECVFIDRSVIVTNRSATKRRAYQYIDGNRGGGYTLAPGEWFSFYFSDILICSNGVGEAYSVIWEDEIPMMEVNASTGEFSYQFKTNSALVYTNVGGLSGLSNSHVAVIPTNSNLVPWSSAADSFINFTATSATAAKDDTLKAGFNVLAQQLSDINKSIDLGTIATLRSSNGVSGGGSDGVADALTAFHHDNTNLLGGILGALTGTNGIGGTNSLSGEEAASSVAGLLSSLTNGAPSEIDLPMESLGSDWLLTIPLAGSSVNMNLNPFSLPWVNDLAALVRRLAAWGLLSWLIIYCTRHALNTIAFGAQARQATAASAVPVISSASATAMAIAITVILGTMPSFYVAWLGGHIGDFFISPWTGVNVGAIKQSLYMADQFLPLALTVAVVINAYVFEVTLGVLLWVSTTIVRFFVG